MNPAVVARKQFACPDQRVRMKHFAAILSVFLASTVVGAWAASVARPTCGGTTSSKDILLVNPMNPPRGCVYHITATSSYVCQLRIDFSYTLAQPSVPSADNHLEYVECDNDYFQVGGLRLCGSERDQHIYVPFNRTAGATKLDMQIVLAARVGGTHRLPTPVWSMRVTQLECPAGAAIRDTRSPIKDGFFVAPPGCLQYFPQSTGVVKSFNFMGGQGVYPALLNYAICFRRTTATNALKLRFDDFRLGAERIVGNNLNIDNNCYTHLRTVGRSEDFLLIPQSIVLENDIRATYFCGDSIKNYTVVSSNPGPLMMVSNSDGLYKFQQETGFSFAYWVL